MRKLLLFIGVLLVVHAALLLVHPSGAAVPPTGDAVDVGVVFDLGGRGDKSFNDGAYLGAERAEKELGVRVRFIEPGEGSDRESGLRLLAAEGMDLVIGVGFIFTDDLTQLAKEYPNTKFAGVDYSLATDKEGKVLPPPPNLAALKFREEQGSFLVGALAALVGRSKKVGFVGGMDFPLIQKFEMGYKAGVKKVCPDCEVISQYAGVTPEAFRNPGKGKELALTQREIFEVLRSRGASPPALPDLVSRVEVACYAHTPPNDAEIVEIRRAAVAILARPPVPSASLEASRVRR